MADAKNKLPKKKTATEEKTIIEEIKAADIAVANKEAQEIVEEAVHEETPTAKAGKRSAKTIKENEAKVAKKIKKEQTEEEPSQAPKLTSKPTRTRLERRSQKYRQSMELIEKGKQYSLKEASELAIKTNPAKFDASVELHVNLGVDPKQADQNIRNTVTLPAGTGKSVKIAVFADVDDAKKAKAAGADIAGGEEFLQQLDKNTLDFDVLISTPLMMPKLAKYARILGPKGLMPNPKSGTVATDITKAVKEAKGGKVEYRVDSTGIVHLSVGKTSFKPEQILENLQTVLASIKAAKPASIKGSYIQAIHVSTTMGPGIPVLLSEV